MCTRCQALVCTNCHIKGIGCALSGYCGFEGNTEDICAEHAQYVHLCRACYAQETLDIADVLPCCYKRARKQAFDAILRLETMPLS